MGQLKEIYGFSEDEVTKVIELYKLFSLKELNIKINSSLIEIQHSSSKVSDSNEKLFHGMNQENHEPLNTSFLKEQSFSGRTGNGNQEHTYHEVRSPIAGTFYQAPSPDAQAFVQVGDYVVAGKTLCIVEAMKNMNEVRSDVAGKVMKILVENENVVAQNQVLFLVET